MSSIKERVIHVLDPTAASHIPLFLPRISVTRGSADDEGEEEIRPFQNVGDIERVMDYSNMPDPPNDCVVMHCEAPGVGNDEEGKDDDGSGIVFPKRSAHLRGGYIFLSQPKDNINDNDSANSSGGKIACIPLAGCSVDFPPGGRRVFREHAHTGARAGYEMAIQVKSNDGSKVTCYIVLDSLGLRESWAGAIRLRCDVGNKITKVRPGGIAGSRLMSAGEDIDGYYVKGSKNNLPSSAPTGSGMSSRHSKKQKQWGLQKPQQTDGPASSGNADLDAAIDQFGIHGFQEEKWLDEYLRKNSARELPGECDKLEKWMDVIKNGLRGAVLEQYEYFVEASREMSTMGREVAWIRTLVERQQEVLMSMKNIDFGTGLEELDEAAGDDDEYGYLSDEDKAFQDAGKDDASSVVSSSSEESSNKGSSRTPMRGNRRPGRIESRQKSSGSITPIDEGEPTVPSNSIFVEIPAYLSDVNEEASAFVKESRYSDATALILKGKKEIAEILEGHEQQNSPVVNVPASLRNPPSSAGGVGKKLHKKQQALLQRTNLQLDALIDRMAKRLAENLRRKNEALKASAKRERADPLSTLAPLVSPVCLNDDAVALHLLVKLGRHQEAATAYAARRSLLLSECLHERPISSPVGMDAVIYAAQLSSSFFSSLAMAVEGFLDLFMDPDADKSSGNDDDTSIKSTSLGIGGGKRVPSGALSAIVLWCDSELTKFTNVFGSARLLSSLALSPPGLRNQADSPEKKISLAKEREVSLHHLFLRLLSQYFISRTLSSFNVQHSMEVAAKCVEQAFSFASENLDSIGLPLTPKLAENMRPRLKGCEAEIAALLDPRWKALVFEWTAAQERTS